MALEAILVTKGTCGLYVAYKCVKFSTCRFKRSTSCYSTALYGGSGGGAFSEHPDICAATVISIIIRSGSLVDGIQLKYNLADGTYYQGSHHGGYGGGYEEFWLDFNAGERVVGVLGKSGNLVDQLGFITSLGRTIGPYGGSGGSSFKVDGCQVRGIYGRSGSLLDSIGFYCSAV